jgi:hypothetical protein
MAIDGCDACVTHILLQTPTETTTTHALALEQKKSKLEARLLDGKKISKA